MNIPHTPTISMHCVNCVHSVGLWLVVPWADLLMLWLHHPLTPLVPLVPQHVPMEEIIYHAKTDTCTCTYTHTVTGPEAAILDWHSHCDDV